MKTIYLFTKDAEGLNYDSVLFWLSVGSSLRSLAKLSLLQEYSKDCGYFLQKRSADVDSWYMQQCEALRPDSNAPSLYVRQASMTVEKFYDIVMKGALDTFISSLSLPSSFFRDIVLIDETYSRKHLDNLKPSLAPFCQRKHLSKNPSKSCVITSLQVILLSLQGLFCASSCFC